MPAGRLRFWLLAGLILALHLGLLLLLLDRGMAETIDVEESFVAFVAQDMRSGPAYPWTSYTYSHYEHGTLLVGLLTVPVFALLGSTVLALKLVSIGMSLLTVLLVMLLGRQFSGEACGLFAGLIVATGPPAWLIRGVQTLGDTSEVLLLVLAQWLVAEWFASRRERGLAAGTQAVLLGLITGLGLTFSLAMLPSLIALCCHWLVTKRARPGLRLVALGLVGALLPLLLPLWNLWRHAIPFYKVRGLGPSELLALSQIGQTAREIFGEPGRSAYLLGREASWFNRSWLLALARVHYGVPMLCFVGLLWRCRTERDGLPYVLLYGAYLAAYLTSRASSPHLLLLLTPAAALLMARCLCRSSQRMVLALLLVALQLMPLGDLATRAGGPIYEAPACARPSRWYWRLETYKLGERLGSTHDPAELFGIGQRLANMMPGQPTQLRQMIAGLPRVEAEAVCRGFGYERVWERVDDWIAHCEALGPGLGDAAFRGAGRCVGERYPGQLPSSGEEIRALLPPGRVGPYLEGVGFGLGSHFWHQPLRYRLRLSFLPVEQWAHVERGLRRRLRRMTSQPEGRIELLALLRQGLCSLPSGPSIRIRAKEMVSGNVSLDQPGFVGLAIDGGSAPGRAAFELRIERSGVYELWACYATAEHRRMVVALDGRVVLRPAGRLTGGFGRAQLSWECQGRLRLRQGMHSLALISPGAFPHLAELRLFEVHR